MRAELVAGEKNSDPVEVGIRLQAYSEEDVLDTLDGPRQLLFPGQAIRLEWRVPDLGGAPIVHVGIFVSSNQPAEGIVHLDYLAWDGSPQVVFRRSRGRGRMWKRQWVNAADFFEEADADAFRVIQNRGRGLVITGTREWQDYSVHTRLIPHLAKAFGLAARVQGLERYYALMLSDRNTIKLIKRLDGETVLDEQGFDWEFDQPHQLQLTVNGNQISAWVNGALLFDLEDVDRPLLGGGIALVCEAGRIGTEDIWVGPPSEPTGSIR